MTSDADSLRVDGGRIMVYPNDHPPDHVHVLGPGWVVVVSLEGLDIREVVGCNEREARRVTEHRTMLTEAWRRFHG